ncbi:MAG TPA: MMPL family transporter [Solirubrobacteraceae bacterium]|jgi:putative drug exporter of the RND superfamily
MRALARIVTGRRTKWFVLLAWVVLLSALAPLGQKLGDVTDNRTESFLPPNAESTEALRIQEQRFAGGETVGGLVVYQRDGGLTPADRDAMTADAAAAAKTLPLVGKPSDPVVSPGGEVAYFAVALPDDNDKIAGWGKDLREAVRSGDRDGLNVYVTGGVGFNADFEEVFGDIDVKVLGVTVVLVIALLLLIYRAPLIALIPLVVVGIAYSIAQGFVYLYAKSGATVSDNGATILVVLMFGVGTDYCLLLVSRYREELGRYQDKHEAMEHALRRAGPPILASGLTVALTMLVLLLADVGSTHSLGPVSAIGVTVAFVAGLSLLPALLTVAGRRGFWPRRAIVAFHPEGPPEEHAGIWRRVGARVLQRPASALAVTLVLFTAGAFGLLAYKEDYSVTGFFKKQTESADGFDVLRSSLPAGALVPTTVLVVRDGGQVSDADVAAVRKTALGVRGVASVDSGSARSTDGSAARLTVIFDDDPFEASALDRAELLRDRLHAAAPAGTRVLVGDGSAVQADFNDAAARDLQLIVPLALLVIFVILAVLLEAIVAPLLLIGSVVISFVGTLGLSILFFRFVIGDAGVDNSLPTYAFIFLVALGIDYTIFLMSRVREEARRYGTREGTLRALAATGPVITSAGIILAGTFSVLMTLPVTFIFDLGFMVAVGILLDTFVVRTIMVPAIIELVGDRAWWPSTATGGGHTMHETEQDRVTA